MKKLTSTTFLLSLLLLLLLLLAILFFPFSDLYAASGGGHGPGMAAVQHIQRGHFDFEVRWAIRRAIRQADRADCLFARADYRTALAKFNKATRMRGRAATRVYGSSARWLQDGDYHLRECLK